MLLKSVSRSPLMQEFTEEEREHFFGITEKKVLPNIDTLYYNVFCLEDGSCDSGVTELSLFFKSLRDNYNPENPVEVEGMVFRPIRKQCYTIALSLDGVFDMFIAESVPNPDTPRIQIQLRSISLWSEGAKRSIARSFSYALSIINRFHLEFLRVGENRIDYCYHTNCLQNPSQFLRDETLTQCLKSRMTIYQKVGRIGKDVTVEYFSLGQRSSKNLFFRCYNKTREVIEKGYKGIFIPIWHEKRLISSYDRYVLEYAYKYKSFKAGVSIGKIEWYFQYGRDEERKQWLRELRKKYFIKSENVQALDKHLGTYLPEITTIMNIEYQTMRKFYYSYRKAIEGLDCTISSDEPLYPLYRLLDNRKSFLNILTHDTVRFVQDRNARHSDYLDWWKRIRSCKIEDTLADVTMCRTYQRNADADRITNSVASKVSSMAVLKKQSDKGFAANVADLLAEFNDNDRAFLFAVDELGQAFDKFEFVGDYSQYDILLARKERQYKYLLMEDIEEEASPPTEEAES